MPPSSPVVGLLFGHYDNSGKEIVVSVLSIIIMHVVLIILYFSLFTLLNIHNSYREGGYSN